LRPPIKKPYGAAEPPTIVRLSAEDAGRLLFRHERTDFDAGSAPLCGTTRWSARYGELQVFLLWRWTMIEAGCLCLDDPLHIDSNAYVVGEKPLERRRRLLVAASGLDWQAISLSEIHSIHQGKTGRP
jgi:hypothetical protein